MRAASGVAVGVMLSLWTVHLAFVMAGGGHGWCSALPVSFVSLLVFPALGLACVRPRAHLNRFLAIVWLVVLTGADVWLVLATRREGVEYYQKVVAMTPQALVHWYLAWGSAHVVAVVLFAMHFIKALPR